MKRTAMIGMLAALLSGCASSNMPKEVYIPVSAKQPVVKVPPKPVLPIAKLKKDSKPNDVIKAYAASVEILQGYSDQLIKILRAYGNE